MISFRFYGYIGFIEAYLKGNFLLRVIFISFFDTTFRTLCNVCFLGTTAMRKRIRGILMSGKQFSLDSHLDLVQGIVNHATHRPSSEPTSGPPLLEDKNETNEDSPDKDNNGVLCQSGTEFS